MLDDYRFPDYGYRFYHWTVISPVERKGQEEPLFLCKCDCGAMQKISTLIVYAKDNSNMKSCGCLSRYTPYELLRLDGPSNYSPEYTSWMGANSRCHRPEDKSFERYRKKDRNVCDRWNRLIVKGKGFENFVNDMGRKPTPHHTIDRYPNNEDGYYKENCRWATVEEQNSNTYANRYITINGERITVTEAAKKYNLGLSTIFTRLRNGWKEDKLADPVENKARSFRHDGKEWRLFELAEKHGVSEDALYYRMVTRKMPLEQALDHIQNPSAKREPLLSMNHIVDLNGEYLTIKDLAVRYSLSQHTVRTRVLAGKTGNELIKPASADLKFPYKEKDYKISELSEMSGINFATLRYRLVVKRMSVEEALSTPVGNQSSYK